MWLSNAQKPTTLPLRRHHETQRNPPTKGTTRWRCTLCGASSVKRRNDITNAAVFTQFIEHCTTAISLDDLAKRNGVSRATMKRRFKWCWLVDVPDPTAGHHKRIYDQVFLDGTYTAGGCLIVAATIDHVIAWHWCKHETTRDYQLLLERIEAPLIAVIDGGQGAYSAIKKCWPTTKIQRCLVHAQRVVRRYTTTNPRTDAGRTIYRLALKLTRITTLDEAAAWGVQLHEFSTIYREWMNEKTMIKDPKTGAWTRVWTHHNVRKAYNSLNHLWRSEMLFVYLNPPAGVLAPERINLHPPTRPSGLSIIAISAPQRPAVYLPATPTNNHRPRQPCSNNKQPRRWHQRPHKRTSPQTPRTITTASTHSDGLVAVSTYRSP
ncbi:transposase for insertion sequence [Corynebacterium urealyticum DSM 7111]|nr:transposase for insertion sequence [Corynebacterium urealyticum DSM 7111]